MTEIIGLIVGTYILYVLTKWIMLALTAAFAVGCLLVLVKTFR